MTSRKGNAPFARRVGRKAQGIGTSRQAKNNTQQATIGAALKAGEEITALTAFRRFGCLRLASVVHSLRRLGWRIATERVSIPRSDGRVSIIARYRLKASAKT
jgi:hypothetical protein